MSEPFKIEGQRGELSLFIEDDAVAFDVAEYSRIPKTSEMFVHHTDIPKLVRQLQDMHSRITTRVLERAERAADLLDQNGVRPLTEPLTHYVPDADPGHLESLALTCLRRAEELRQPQLPF